MKRYHNHGSIIRLLLAWLASREALCSQLLVVRFACTPGKVLTAVGFWVFTSARIWEVRFFAIRPRVDQIRQNRPRTHPGELTTTWRLLLSSNDSIIADLAGFRVCCLVKFGLIPYRPRWSHNGHHLGI
jgi:hypothetical protein